MKKNRISLIGASLGVIGSSCALMVTLSYMIEASDKIFIFKYCSAMAFFIAIALITLYSIFSSKLPNKIDKTTFNILKTINIVFSIVLILLLASQFFIYDYQTGAFGVTFNSIVIILLIMAIIFIGKGKFEEFSAQDAQKELEVLQSLLENGLISPKEYEMKRKAIVGKL